MFAEVVFDWAWDEQIRSRRICLRSPNEAISVTLHDRLRWSVIPLRSILTGHESVPVSLVTCVIVAPISLAPSSFFIFPITCCPAPVSMYLIP